LSVPSASKEGLRQLLPLQIEREFPLPPRELAWGFCPLREGKLAGNGSAPVQEVLVVAVKRDVLQEYAEILARAGLDPVFTLGALARSSLCPHPPTSYAVIEVGPNHAELISFDDGVPNAVRILPWGSDDFPRLMGNGPRAEHIDVETAPLDLSEQADAGGAIGAQTQIAVRADIPSIARHLPRGWLGQKLYWTGVTPLSDEQARQLARLAGDGIECEPLNGAAGDGRSAATLGLRKQCEENNGSPAVIFQMDANDRGDARAVQPASWKWAALAGVLVLMAFCLPYAEAVLQKPRLAKRITELKAYRQTLPDVDRELSFLQYLKTNQPPYLDALSALASAAPAGTRMETVAMNRRGDLSLRATMRDSQQVVDFRTKLVASGLFSTVTVDEQTPSSDRQKITVRISAQWRQPIPGQPAGQADPRPSTSAELARGRVDSAESAVKGTNAIVAAEPRGAVSVAPTNTSLNTNTQPTNLE
jgi:Tfp pilus assembly protein PilN